MSGWIRGSARERRRTARRTPDATESLSRVRLRTGRELDVIDLSNTGALVEGAVRLLPGTHVDVHVVTRNGRVLVRSRVTRARVCHLEADAVRYRGAIAFDQPIDSGPAGYGIPAVLLEAEPPSGISYPAAGETVNETRANRPESE